LSALPRVWAEAMAMPGHSIRIILDDRRIWKMFNCFAYATGIYQLGRYQEVYRAAGCQSAIANSKFVERLIETGELTPAATETFGAGDVVLCYDRGVLKHAALAVSDVLLRSKWGSNELCEHGLWEVGTEYGNEVRVCPGPNRLRVVALLEAWVRDKGEND
jgi:hypothetical protein